MRQKCWLLLKILFDPIDPSYVKEWRKDHPDFYDLIPKLGRSEKDYLIQSVTLLGMVWSDDRRVDASERQLIKDYLKERRIPQGLKAKWHLKKLFRKPVDVTEVIGFYDRLNLPVEQLVKQVASIEKRVTRAFSSRYVIYFNALRNFFDDRLKTESS